MGRYTKLARALREPRSDAALGRKETENVVDQYKSVNINSNLTKENKHTTHPQSVSQPSEPPDGGGSTNLRSTNLTNFIPVKSVKSAETEDACNAARSRLRERVRVDVRPGPGKVLIAGEVDVRRAVEIVMAYEDRLFTAVLVAADRGHAELGAAARRVRAGLASIGREYPEAEVLEAVRELVRELFPSGPAAEWDADWAADLMGRAMRYVFVERFEAAGVAYEDLDASCLDDPENEISAAFEAEDRARYRAAVRAWARAALREIARSKAARDGRDRDAETS